MMMMTEEEVEEMEDYCFLDLHRFPSPLGVPGVSAKVEEVVD